MCVGPAGPDRVGVGLPAWVAERAERREAREGARSVGSAEGSREGG